MVLETVAAVVAIVSAFQGAAALYNAWKARKEASSRAAGSEVPSDNVTQQSLLLGRTVVQAEYDRALSRVGERFARGDGKAEPRAIEEPRSHTHIADTDEGRMQLQEEVISLQQTVIALLQKARDRRDGRLDVSGLMAASENRRTGTVRALASQYQRMAVAAPIQEPSLAERNSRTNYFAFASNIHIEQMAKRCPTSLFRGKAVLRGYRWQINERGFANIVQSPAHRVEGLVFSITYEDRTRLDRYEGVAKGFYERRDMPVQLTEYTSGPWKTSYVAARLRKGAYPSRDAQKATVDASVYISLTYVSDGRIRAEYAVRMDRALKDAIELGMSRQYVQQYMTPRINATRSGSSRSGGTI